MKEVQGIQNGEENEDEKENEDEEEEEEEEDDERRNMVTPVTVRRRRFNFDANADTTRQVTEAGAARSSDEDDDIVPPAAVVHPTILRRDFIQDDTTPVASPKNDHCASKVLMTKYHRVLKHCGDLMTAGKTDADGQGEFLNDILLVHVQNVKWTTKTGGSVNHRLDDNETSVTFVGRSHGMINKLMLHTSYASMHDDQFTGLAGNRNYTVTRVVAAEDVSIDEAIRTRIDDEISMRI